MKGFINPQIESRALSQPVSSSLFGSRSSEEYFYVKEVYKLAFKIE
jgi:hypothetical protein